jgi:hypothetical protein
MEKNIVLSQKWTIVACIYPQTTIHLGAHDHFVVEGWSGEVFDQVKSIFTLGLKLDNISQRVQGGVRCLGIWHTNYDLVNNV